MTTLTNPHTIATLRELGCIGEEERMSGQAVAVLLARRLEDNHIADSLDEVVSVEATVGQLATAIIGEEDPEFVDAIRPLLSGSATGKVQKALSNGHLLCASRTLVTISIEGETVNRSISTRFLSADPDVIDKYVLGPNLRKAENFAKRTRALGELVGRRQPNMDGQLTLWTDRLNVTWHKAIEGGS